MPNVTEYDATNISGTQPLKNMIIMGKIDTSDLMMIITHTNLYIVMTMRGNRED